MRFAGLNWVTWNNAFVTSRFSVLIILRSVAVRSVCVWVRLCRISWSVYVSCVTVFWFVCAQ